MNEYNTVSPVKVESTWEAFEKYHTFWEEYQRYETSGITMQNEINPICLNNLQKENKSVYAIFT